jgi:hypothetical protein
MMFMIREIDDVLDRVGDLYLALIHADKSTMLVVQPLLELVSELKPGLALTMIWRGESWRERLVGLVLVARESPEAIADAILTSLRDPRGFAITASCAALASLANHIDVSALLEDHLAHFDLSAFDGEVGWALDRMRATAARQSLDSSKSPNGGQSFANHFDFYSALYPAAI